MNWRKVVAVWLLPLGLLPFACSGGPEVGSVRPEGSSVSATPAGTEGVPQSVVPAPSAAALVVSESSPERLAGTYVSGTDANIGLRFVSSKDAGGVALWLSDLKGNELLAMTGSTSAGVVIRHGGELTVRMAAALVARKVASVQGGPPAPPDPAGSSGGGALGSDITMEGNVDKFAGIESRPEWALLPELSRALGERGFNGRKLPSALPLHAYAMKFASNSLAARSAAAPAHGAKTGEATSGARPSFICTTGDVECCELHPNDPGCVPDPPPGDPTPCAQPPIGSSCYGMCGPGCDCWPNICGDCCYHNGCAIHDQWCGACSWTAPWYCYLCYSEAALIALAAC